MLLLSETAPANLAHVNYAVVLIGGVFLYGAWYLHRKRLRLRRSGLPATGVVIRLKPSDDYHESERTYTPVFRFETLNREVIEVQHWYGSSPPFYQVGQRVQLLYNPLNPQDYLLDTGAVWNELSCGLIGVGCIISALWTHFGE